MHLQVCNRKWTLQGLSAINWTLSGKPEVVFKSELSDRGIPDHSTLAPLFKRAVSLCREGGQALGKEIDGSRRGCKEAEFPSAPVVQCTEGKEAQSSWGSGANTRAAEGGLTKGAGGKGTHS
jgi:hypothetical protein